MLSQELLDLFGSGKSDRRPGAHALHEAPVFRCENAEAVRRHACFAQEFLYLFEKVIDHGG